MSLKEKQAAAKQTFVFLGSLANEYPAKQDVECDSTEFVSSRYNRDKQKRIRPRSRVRNGGKYAVRNPFT